LGLPTIRQIRTKENKSCRGRRKLGQNSRKNGGSFSRVGGRYDGCLRIGRPFVAVHRPSGKRIMGQRNEVTGVNPQAQRNQLLKSWPWVGMYGEKTAGMNNEKRGYLRGIGLRGDKESEAVLSKRDGQIRRAKILGEGKEKRLCLKTFSAGRGKDHRGSEASSKTHYEIQYRVLETIYSPIRIGGDEESWCRFVYYGNGGYDRKQSKSGRMNGGEN